MLIEQTPDRYLRAPQLEATADGGALLHLIAWEPQGECVLRYQVAADRTLADAPVALDHAPAIVGFDARQALVVFGDPAREERANSGGWEALIDREGARTSVKVKTPFGQEHLVWSALGIATSPAIATASGGAWVAFHHDVREDDGRPDIAKWIALRFVDLEGNVFEVDAPMLERDRDAQGEQQSFEFPTLVVGEDGAVDLFGRGSHNFYRQRVNAAGFSARQALSDGQWGCRGRRMNVARLTTGETLTACRERKGIALRWLDGPVGGAPQLKPAKRKIKQPAFSVPRKPTWDGPQVLFGDIQQHSAHSDGIGAADEAYLRARYRYGDDFTALTDHESFLGKRMGPGEWAYLQAVAERHNEPGEFATIVAYEWTGQRHPGPGHKCVYLPGSGYDLVSRDVVPDGRGIVAYVAEVGGVTGPHHIGWTGADEAGHDPKGQPVWEICSCHGCYEFEGHPLGHRGDLSDQFVQPMLNKGLRFGFIACSDSHGLLWHHGECRKRDPFRTGLTGVITRQRTRESILGAIKERRCYATSGEKILLDFSANGGRMGSEQQAHGGVTVEARAQGVRELSALELVGPGGVVAQGEVDGAQGTLQCKVSPAAYFYARATQVDGEMAWSSPIFFDAN